MSGKNTWAANKADRLVRHMGIVCQIAKQNRIMLGPISELGAKLGKCESKDQTELAILLSEPESVVYAVIYRL